MRLHYHLLIFYVFFSLGCGLKSSLKDKKSKEEQKIYVEFTGMKSFWTARFPGEDGKFGAARYQLHTDANVPGIVIPELIKEEKNVLQHQMDSMLILANEDPSVRRQLAKISKKLRGIEFIEKNLDTMDYASGYDDFLVEGEVHLPVNTTIHASFRSMDVIHGAFMPHFKINVLCVPGMDTRVRFETSKTTVEMRKELNNPKFDYILLCNRICGQAHYQMTMKIIVEEWEDFNVWMDRQSTFQKMIKKPLKSYL